MSKHVKILDNGSAEITLGKGFEIAGTEVKVLVMREPTVNDQLAMETIKTGAAAQEVSLFANLTTQAPEDIQKLTLRDYKRLQEAFGLFTD